MNLFVIGQSVSMVGSRISHIAVGFSVYRESQNVSAFSLILFLSYLPNILSSLFGGALVDRSNFRFIFGVGNLVLGLLTILAGMSLFLNGSGVDGSTQWIIYILVFVTAGIGALQWIGLNSFLPAVFSGDDLSRYNGYFSTANSFAGLLAPPMAGMLSSWVSLQSILIFDGITFLLSSIVVFLFFNSGAKQTKNSKSVGYFREVTEGFEYLRRNAVVLQIIALFSVSNFFAGISTNLSTPLFLERYSSETTGIVLAAIAFGSLFVGFLQSTHPDTMRAIKTLHVPMALIAIANIAVGIFNDWLFVFAINFTLGMLLGVIDLKAKVMLQESVGAEYRGRVFATARGLSWICFPAAQLVCAILARQSISDLFHFTSKSQFLGSLLILANGFGLATVFALQHFIQRKISKKAA